MDKCKEAGIAATGDLAAAKKIANINVNTGGTGGSDYNSERDSCPPIGKGKAGGSDYNSGYVNGGN